MVTAAELADEVRRTTADEVDALAGTYTVTDRSVTVVWQAGLDVSGGVPRPVLRAQKGFQQGTVREVSFRREYGMDDDGGIGAAVAVGGVLVVLLVLLVVLLLVL